MGRSGNKNKAVIDGMITRGASAYEIDAAKLEIKRATELRMMKSKVKKAAESNPAINDLLQDNDDAYSKRYLSAERDPTGNYPFAEEEDRLHFMALDALVAKENGIDFASLTADDIQRLGHLDNRVNSEGQNNGFIDTEGDYTDADFKNIQGVVYGGFNNNNELTYPAPDTEFGLHALYGTEDNEAIQALLDEDSDAFYDRYVGGANKLLAGGFTEEERVATIVGDIEAAKRAGLSIEEAFSPDMREYGEIFHAANEAAESKGGDYAANAVIALDETYAELKASRKL